MDNEIKELLGEEIKTEIRDLSLFPPGSNEKSAAIDDLAKLYNLKIEEAKNDLEESNKTIQKSEQAKDRYFKFAADAISVVLPLVFYAVWMETGLKFEETGTFTSSTFKGLLARFRPTK